MNVLSPSQSNLDGPSGQINFAIILTEKVFDNFLPVRSAPYRAGPKSIELEKVEMEEILAQKSIEPAGTERIARIVCVPQKLETL